jgi:hypothetical protein
MPISSKAGMKLYMESVRRSVRDWFDRGNRMKQKPFHKFKSGHGRDGVIAVVNDKCHVCGQAGPVLAIDTSVTFESSEYGAGKICEKCATRAFAEAKTHKPLAAD